MPTATIGPGIQISYDTSTAYANTVEVGVDATLPVPGAHSYVYISQVDVFWRRKYGATTEAWQSRSQTYSPPKTSGTAACPAYVGLHHAWQVEYYFRIHYGVVYDPGYGTSYATIYGSPLYSRLMQDNADPTLSVSISNDSGPGGYYPTAGGRIKFHYSLTDAVEVLRVRLWVDGTFVEEDVAAVYRKSLSGTLSKSGLTKGSHTYQLVGYDYSGRTDTESGSFTVLNAPPTVPTSLAVNGKTSSVSVARAADHTVSWAASTDPNPEDTAITYDLQELPPGGSWTDVATGISGTSQTWNPGTVGSWQLRVRASDGTDSSDWATLPVTVVSSTAPNTPTINTPTDSPWREGEMHLITWTEASPLDPDGDSVTYRLQFSEAGDFSDAIDLASGLSSGTTVYSWTIEVGTVSADTTTAKLRIRAEDSTGMVSSWSTTSAFTVLKDQVPTVTWVDPVDEDQVERGDVTLILQVADADSDRIHIEIEGSLVSSFSLRTFRYDSSVSQDGIERAASPYSSWSEIPAEGADSGDRIRVTVTLSRYDRYYLRARVTDGIVYSDWATIWVQSGPAADEVILVTVGDESYHVTELFVDERTGGEPSGLEFVISRGAYAAAPFATGDAVTAGLRLGAAFRTWNGTVEVVSDEGASVRVRCLLDDAYLQRKLATQDYTEADIGTNLAALIDDCGAPLDSSGIDTTLGVDAEIVGGYQTVGKHLADWASALGLVLWVDSEGTVYLKDPADCTQLDYAIVEAEP